MKTIALFEKKMREANYASLPAARVAIAEHPLTPEYIVDLLCSRGIIRVTDSGSVVGCGESSTGPVGDDGPKPWDPRWADKKRIMAWLDCDEDGDGVKFRKLQEYLESDNQPHSHWLTLHAVWNLMKEGLVEKRQDGYRLTKSGRAVTAARAARDEAVFLECLKKVGAPYLSAKVFAELKNTPDHDWFYGCATDGSWPDQDFIDKSVKRLKAEGSL
jgi:hypothetical protein